MSKKKASIQATPIHAWVEDQRSKSTRDLLEAQEEEALLFENMTSQEDVLYLPPMEQNISSASNLRSDLEKKTLEYIQSFIRSTGQDASKRLRLMDQVDILSATMGSDTSCFSAPAVSVIKFLIPWTASNHVQERERAMQKIIHLSKRILTCSDSKVLVDFPITGELLGCFALCYSDRSEVVSHWASEGLHLLYEFVTSRAQRRTSEDTLILPFLMEWEQEDGLFANPMHITSFADPVEITMVFKKLLQPTELTDFIIAAVTGMRDDSAHSTTVAIYTLKAILRDHNLALGKVSKAVDAIHHNLDAISNSWARQEAFKTLRFMGKNYTDQVVKALLLCSPECDNTATDMWKALVCFSNLATRILGNLLICLQSKPLMQDGSSKEVVLFPVAATNALEKILQQPLPTCTEELKNIWGKLCLALIFWLSQTFHLRVWEIESIQNQLLEMSETSPLSLARSAINTLRMLLRCVGCENEVLLMKKLSVWDLLVNAETHHQGVSHFARGVARNRPHEPEWMVDYAMAVLDDPNDNRHVTAMAFLVELLQCPDLGSVRDEVLLKCLCKHLASSKVILRSLALEGILRLMDNQVNVMRLQPLLSDVLKSLQEFDRENTLKALRLVKLLANQMVGPSCGPFAVEVAPQVFPFFDDGSHKVRSLAISLFGNLLEMVTTRQNKQKMRAHALCSLVPLLVHLHDCSLSVIQTKLYRKDRHCHFLSQSIKYLRSPQPPIREVAVRLVGLGGQETRSRRKLETICKVLEDLKDDPRPSICCLTTETIKNLETHHDQIRSRSTFWMPAWLDYTEAKRKGTATETPSPGGSQQITSKTKGGFRENNFHLWAAANRRPMSPRPLWKKLQALQCHFTWHLEIKDKEAEGALKQDHPANLSRQALVTYRNYAWLYYRLSHDDLVERYLGRIHEICQSLSSPEPYSILIPEVHAQQGWSLLAAGLALSVFAGWTHSWADDLNGEAKGLVEELLIRQTENNDEAKGHLARLLQRTDLRRASRLVEDVIQNSLNPEVLRNAARICRAQSPSRAISVLQRAIALEPSYHLLHYDPGVQYMKQMEGAYPEEKGKMVAARHSQ
ncbi:hypothetical protein lerEdw1_020857 [Lerista edwardsae]|nr:hypothetical protein lerEdw1_020857 [Lerista edwardsae]